MKIIKNKMILILLFGTVLLSTTSCSLSKAEKNYLDRQSTSAEKYYEKKYDCDIQITDSGYDYSTSLFFTYDTDQMYFTTSEDTVIYYDVKSKYFSDNKQAPEILEKVESQLLPKLTGKIGLTFYWDETSFSCNTQYYYETEESNFFRKYYDADEWENFFLSERPSAYFKEPLYVISAETTDHNHIANQLAKSFRKYFDLSSLEVIFLSEEVYNQLEEYGNDYKGEDGFYASYRISDSSISIVKQNYVKITDGVYITSRKEGLIFEEGDFSVSGELTLNDVLTTYQNAYDTHYDRLKPDNSYLKYQPVTTDASEGVGYRLQFGDSCMEKMEALPYSDWFYCCIKIVPSELNFTADEFGLVTIHKNDLPDLRKFDLDDSDKVTYLYVYRTSATETFLYFGEKKEIVY